MSEERVSVAVKKLRGGAVLPRYMSDGASGCDVVACLDAPMTIAPLARVAVPTGLAFAVPPGFEVQVRPRSGFAFKKGLTVVNAPGTIDSDYRGEVQILLVNLGDQAVEVAPGDRIAQFVLARAPQIDWRETDSLEESARGAGGFGSTGFHDRTSETSSNLS